MRAGLLSTRITIQRVTETRDAMGGVAETWANLATRWAAIESISGGEADPAGRPQAEATTRIRLRYGSDLASLSPKDRVSFGSRLFDILLAQNQNESNRMIVLQCREVAS